MRDKAPVQTRRARPEPGPARPADGETDPFMLQFFRNFFKSKLGVGITLAFLVVIAIAFASSDISSSGTFGGVSGGDRVAVVGNRRIDASELTAGAGNMLDQMRQQNPTLTMQVLVAQGGFDRVLDQLLQRTAVAEFARINGMRAGKRLVDSELRQMPAFRGADGNFDENAFRAALAQRRLTESMVRDDLESGLLARQLLTPIAFSPMVPQSFAQQYASLLRERRQGTVALLPSAVFAPTGNPTDAQLQAFYKESASRFVRPERRVIRFASFGEEVVGNLPAPTAAQIQERYQRDRATYAAVERRSFTQLVVPTQAAAQAIVTEVRGGRALDVAAREKGLATASIGPVTQAELTTNASAAVAQAAFAAQSGAIATPARGGLGWYVLRVDAIDKRPARTLDQARGEIVEALTAEQRRAALDDLTADIEDRFDKGENLADVARELKLTLTTTAPATADGRIYRKQGETVPQVLGPVLKTAFDMEEEEPQLAPVVPGQTYVIFDVPEITQSATAPLADIRDDVIALWRRDQGSKAAKAAADRIEARVKQGTALAAAVAAETRPLPPPQPIDLTREQLARQGQVPPSLALFFSMAEGTVKRLEAPDEAGWYVIQLADIEAGKVTVNDQLVFATAQQLGRVSGEEYVRQFVNAIQNDVGVERNETAILAVRNQLTGAQGE
jgi:peptidyl-prolyl cis-trans isomerase D